MKSTKIPWSYNGNQITFEFSDENVYVNATEMAKPFGKRVANFLRLDSTQNFVKSYLYYSHVSNKSHFAIEDLVISSKKGGTWVHNIIAIELAAWLEPAFRFWMNEKIVEILTRFSDEIKANCQDTAEMKSRIKILEEKFQVSSPQEWEELQLLKRKVNKNSRDRSKLINYQISLFSYDLQD